MQRVKNRMHRLRMFIGGGTYAEMVAKNRQKFIDLFVKNIYKTITLIITLYGIYFYFRYVRNRVSKLLSVSYNKYTTDRTIGRISLNESCVNTKLCDIYIASSAKTYLPGNQKYDYASELAITNAIRLGARFIELDIYNDSFCPNANPIVFNGIETGNWQYTSSITFDQCCKTISKIAFNRAVLTNYDDPLFIYLNLYLNGNSQTADKVVAILNKYFGKIIYTMKDDANDIDVTELRKKTLKSFIGKVVIFTNSTEYNYAGIGSYKLRNIVSATPYDDINHTGGSDIIMYTSNKIDDIYDMDEAGSDHQISLSFVFPEFIDRLTQNFHAGLSLAVGCQFIAMNYQHVDDSLDFYINTIFKSSSFIKKPNKLLYKEKIDKYVMVMDSPDAAAISDIAQAVA